MKARYRIVSDNYLGHEVQVWHWWFPFWTQPTINTFHTIEAAEEYVKRITNKSKTIKYLGWR